MNGKLFMSSLFDSMISWTLDEVNHLSTIKKLTSNDYLSKFNSEYEDKNNDSINKDPYD
jgi:hypothetical protein